MTTPAQKPWRRTRLTIAALLLALLATFIVWRIGLSFRVNAKLKAIAQAGYPVTLPDLESAYYPELKPGENAALFFGEAFTHLNVTNSAKDLSAFWITYLLAADST